MTSPASSSTQSPCARPSGRSPLRPSVLRACHQPFRHRDDLPPRIAARDHHVVRDVGLAGEIDHREVEGLLRLERVPDRVDHGPRRSAAAAVPLTVPVSVVGFLPVWPRPRGAVPPARRAPQRADLGRRSRMQPRMEEHPGRRPQPGKVAGVDALLLEAEERLRRLARKSPERIGCPVENRNGHEIEYPRPVLPLRNSGRGCRRP